MRFSRDGHLAIIGIGFAVAALVLAALLPPRANAYLAIVLACALGMVVYGLWGLRAHSLTSRVKRLIRDLDEFRSEVGRANLTMPSLPEYPSGNDRLHFAGEIARIADARHEFDAPWLERFRRDFGRRLVALQSLLAERNASDNNLDKIVKRAIDDNNDLAITLLPTLIAQLKIVQETLHHLD